MVAEAPWLVTRTGGSEWDVAPTVTGENTAADDISGYAIHADGTLQLLDANGVTATAGDAPADLALRRGSRFLYVRNGRTVPSRATGFALTAG